MQTLMLQRAEETPTLDSPVGASADGDVRMAARPSEVRVVDSKPPSESYPIDRAFHAMLARLTGGISPIALSLACLDWASHLATAPQRQMEIAQDAVRDA